MVVREAELRLVEPPRRGEVADRGALGKRLDRDEHLGAEPLALRRDRVVGDDGELAEGDDDCTRAMSLEVKQGRRTDAQSS